MDVGHDPSIEAPQCMSGLLRSALWGPADRLTDGWLGRMGQRRALRVGDKGGASIVRPRHGAHNSTILVPRLSTTFARCNMERSRGGTRSVMR